MPILAKINARYVGNVYFHHKITDRGQRFIQLSAQPAPDAPFRQPSGRYQLRMSKRAISRKRDDLIRLLINHFLASNPNFKVFGIPAKELLEN